MKLSWQETCQNMKRDEISCVNYEIQITALSFCSSVNAGKGSVGWRPFGGGLRAPELLDQVL